MTTSYIEGLPYTPGMVARILRRMPEERLRAATPDQFHLWPARQIVPTRTIADLISNERARRAA